MSGHSPNNAHGQRSVAAQPEDRDGTPYVPPAYAPQNPVLRWFEARLPIVGLRIRLRSPIRCRAT